MKVHECGDSLHSASCLWDLKEIKVPKESSKIASNSTTYTRWRPELLKFWSGKYLLGTNYMADSLLVNVALNINIKNTLRPPWYEWDDR